VVREKLSTGEAEKDPRQVRAHRSLVLASLWSARGSYPSIGGVGDDGAVDPAPSLVIRLTGQVSSRRSDVGVAEVWLALALPVNNPMSEHYLPNDRNWHKVGKFWWHNNFGTYRRHKRSAETMPGKNQG